jgi:hypothetical protein
VNFHIADAIENSGGLGELAGLRQELMQRELRVGFVEDCPDHAVAICGTDKRIQLRIVKKAFRAAETDVDQAFENGALSERGGVAVNEEKENIVWSGATAEGPELVAVNFNIGDLLRGEARLGGIGGEIAEGDAGDFGGML